VREADLAPTSLGVEADEGVAMPGIAEPEAIPVAEGAENSESSTIAGRGTGAPEAITMGAGSGSFISRGGGAFFSAALVTSAGVDA